MDLCLTGLCLFLLAISFGRYKIILLLINHHCGGEGGLEMIFVFKNQG